ncbi:MAG: MBL fold metallo-hydrolase [Lachnospiraceae bacterium]|nr:MBL fold metallo-hydrolase [Lachnospiraceae bacterium]
MKITEHIYVVGGGKWGFGISHEIDCNVFMIDTGSGLVLIDAGTGLDPERLDANIESHGFSVKDIKAVVLTHYHGDHACGAARLQTLSGCEIYAPELEAQAILTGDEKATSVALAKGGLYPADFVYPKSAHVAEVKDGEMISIGNLVLKAYLCPGHSLQDMVLFAQIDGKNCLFSGDFVFAHGQVLIQCLPDVSLSPYAEAMRRIAKLPIEAIFPGHGVFCLENGVSFVEKAVESFDKGLLPQQLYYFT